MAYAPIRGVKLHHLLIPADAEEEPVPIIMVHGLASSMGFWYMGLAPLLSAHHQIVLYDQRGHGASSMPVKGYAPKALSSDLLDLLDYLDIESAHLVGHSYGGQVALHFAHLHSERLKSLVLADVHLSEIKKRQRLGEWSPWSKIKPRLAEVGVILNEDDCDFGYRLLEVMARIQVEQPRRAKKLIGMFSPFSGSGGQRLARRWLALLENEMAHREIYSHDGIDKQLLKEVNVPTLALYGEHSQAMVSGRVIARNIPDLEFETIVGAGHFFPASKPELMADACHRFWCHRGLLTIAA